MERVRLALVENTDGDGDEYHDDPTWPEVEGLLRALNGINRTYICLYLQEEPNADEFMLVAGGRDGVYVCTVYDGDEFALLDPEHPEDTAVVMVPAGQTTGKYRKHCVSLKQLQDVVRYYMETGLRDGSVTWDRI